MKKIFVPPINKEVVLVDRSQLRASGGVRKMKSPSEANPRAPLPAPPATWDHTRGGSLKYPIMGNDRYGDCYYVAVVKAVATAIGNNGDPWEPDVQQLVARYLDVAGGDNGMYDEQIVAEWTGGLIGPSGPHKLLDRLLVAPGNADAHNLAGWLFGGCIYTAGLPDAWLRNIQAGMVWDSGRGVHADPANGHAMVQTGRDSRGYWVTQTWGLTPPVYVTQNGLMVSDPEIWVAFQREWFSKEGKTPNGHSWEEMRQWWMSLGGKDVGPWQDGPGPGPEPTPGDLCGTICFPGISIAVPQFDVTFDGSFAAAKLLRSGWSLDGVIAILQAILAVLEGIGAKKRTVGAKGSPEGQDVTQA